MRTKLGRKHIEKKYKHKTFDEQHNGSNKNALITIDKNDQKELIGQVKSNNISKFNSLLNMYTLLL